MDADTNGVLSAVEIANAPAALMTLDINTDGLISDEELRPQLPPDAPAGAPPNAPDGNRPRFVPPLLAALDADTDGALSTEEIANAPTALNKLDTNTDGQITGDEMRPARPGGHGRGPGRGGPGGPPPDEQ
jgi:Ca2+-binding EF-hand superfamily protein